MEMFEITQELLDKVFEEDEPAPIEKVITRKPIYESRRSKTRHKAQSRQRLEKAIFGTDTFGERKDFNPAHYGKFANHARMHNFLNRDPYKRANKGSTNATLFREYAMEAVNE